MVNESTKCAEPVPDGIVAEKLPFAEKDIEAGPTPLTTVAIHVTSLLSGLVTPLQPAENVLPGAQQTCEDDNKFGQASEGTLTSPELQPRFGRSALAGSHEKPAARHGLW